MSDYLNRFLRVLLPVVFLFVTISAFGKEPIVASAKKKKYVPPTREQKTDAFYDSLRARADNNRILKNLYPIVFRADSVNVIIHTEDKTFEQWKGKTIRTIEIECVEAFPPDRTGKAKFASGLFKKAGNGMHIKTR